MIEFNVLINQIIGEFYSKDEDRVPTNISYDMAREILLLRNRVQVLEKELIEARWVEMRGHEMGS